MGKCPYLIGWFNKKLEEIDKLPDEHDRSGIAKGRRLPVPKSKYVLALHHITFKKLPLKEFCEIMGINHGTGRNWRNTDKIFREIVRELIEQFSFKFLRRYSEQLESEQCDFENASKLIKECRYYPSVTAEQIISRLEHYGKQKEKESESGSLHTLSTLIHSHRLLFSALLLSLKNDDVARQEFAQTLVQQELQDFDASFKELREAYKNPDAQAALDYAETLAYRLTQFAAVLGDFAC